MWLRRFYHKFPLTIGACILLACASYCLSLISSVDLIAAVCAYTLFSLIGLFTSLTVINYLVLFKKIQVQFLQSNEENSLSLNKRIPIRFYLNLARIYPLNTLSLRLKFFDSDYTPPAIVLNRGMEKEIINSDLSFPHFGNWKIQYVEFTIGDLLGLTRMTGQILLNTKKNFLIAPPLFNSPQQPLVFSSLVAGDIINQSDQKLGDYYNIKKYHPADGMSKIVWKIFARRQELMSRHPEETALPAGKAIVALIADRHSASLARHALNYLEQLKNQDLEFVFSCSGAEQKAAELETAKTLLCNAVWNAQPENFDQSRQIISNLLSQQNNCREIAIFLANDQLAEKNIQKLIRNFPVGVRLFYLASPANRPQKLQKMLYREIKETDNYMRPLLNKTFTFQRT